MNANKKMLIADLLSKDNRQYIIPIYQREYKWKEENCERLVNDILICSKTKKEHFIGSLVIQSESREDGDPNNLKYHLVDGQQRITTMLLVTKALSLVAKEMNQNDESKYVISKTDKIIFIDSDAKDRGYKILPSQNDRDIFNAIISADSYKTIIDNPAIKKSSLIFNSFKKAYDKFKFAINTDHLDIKEDLYNHGLLMLSVVEIMLLRDENAQEIFESINSLGVDLTNSELIRNFLLMSNPNQADLYKNKWKPMQDVLIGEKQMETFVKNYLLTKRAYNINDKDVYKEYVKYANEHLNSENEPDRETLINDLYEYAQIFEPFLKKSDKYSETTNLLMQELRDMDQTTAYPFLIKVFLDFKNGVINEEVLNELINLIIVYLTRRTFCGVPTNTLRSFMLTLYNRIFGKVENNKQRYYDAIYTFLCKVNSRDRMPSKIVTAEKIVEYPLYKNLRFAVYVLYRIENGRYPNPYNEVALTSSPTVEHIIPQNLTNEWITELGKNANDLHTKYLHTLGNLSLSSRAKNSIMSDESFETKKKILKEDGSKFAVLNRSIINCKKFDEKALINRANELINIINEKFKLKVGNVEGMRFEDVVELTFNDDTAPFFKGSKPSGYSLFNVEYNKDSFSGILVEVAKTLFRKFPDKFREIASGDGYSPWTGDRKYLKYSDDENYGVEISEGIRMYTGYQARDCIDFAVHLLAICGIDTDELVIFIKKDTIKKIEGLNKILNTTSN